jgi:DNA-binding transcriptional LysR family regulator
MDDELGTALFVRERFGMSLTATGKKFFIYARQIFDLSNEAIRVVSNLQDKRQIVTIGFIATSLSSFLVDALKGFRYANPSIEFRFHELSPNDQVIALRKNQVDIALIDNPCEAVFDEFETRVLFEVPLMAVIPETHRLAGRKRVSLWELENDEFIGYRVESSSGRNQTIINACRVSGFTPNLRFKADSLVEVLAMIASGTGVCLMPADAVNLPHLRTQFITIREHLEPIRFTATWRRDDSRMIITDLVSYFKQH